MAMQTTQSDLLKQLGPQGIAAAEKHKADQITFSGFSELPPIDAGIARLVDCKFTKIAPGKTNAGKYMFYAAGVVVVPKEVGGIPVYGERTQISAPLYDTPTRTRKTIPEHVEWIQNELRKLGATADGLGAAQLESTAAALKKLQPYFKFRTWKGNKAKDGLYKDREPMTNHSWNGACEFLVQDDGEAQTAGVEDSTELVDGMQPEELPESTETVDEFGDLGSLATAADNGDEKAIEELTSQALKSGISEEDITDAENWTAVAEMIGTTANPSIGEEVAPESGSDAPWEPAKGDVYLYKFIDPKTKKPAKKSSEIEILTVDKKSKNVTIKNLTTGKVHADLKTKKPIWIAWKALESMS